MYICAVKHPQSLKDQCRPWSIASSAYHHHHQQHHRHQHQWRSVCVTISTHILSHSPFYQARINSEQMTDWTTMPMQWKRMANVIQLKPILAKMLALYSHSLFQKLYRLNRCSVLNNVCTKIESAFVACTISSRVKVMHSYKTRIAYIFDSWSDVLLYQKLNIS